MDGDEAAREGTKNKAETVEELLDSAKKAEYTSSSSSSRWSRSVEVL